MSFFICVVQEKLAKIVVDWSPPKRKGKRQVDIEIVVQIFGQDVKWTVPDLETAADRMFKSALKTQAIGRKHGIPMTAYERWFMQEPGPHYPACAIPQEYLAPSKKARTHITATLRDPRLKKFSQMMYFFW